MRSSNRRDEYLVTPAYSMGRGAYHEGLQVDENPYEEGSDEYTEWYLGYAEQSREHFQGFVAYNGQDPTPTDNPYEEGTLSWDFWDCGWDAASYDK